jgi:hypothetical protein
MQQRGGEESRRHSHPEGLSPDRPGMFGSIELNCERRGELEGRPQFRPVRRRALRIPGVEDVRHSTQKPLSESVPIWTHYREPHFESLVRCYNRRS